MLNRKIELTKDPLSNICLMAPMLNETERTTAFAFMYGLLMGNDLGKASCKNKNEKDYKEEIS